ncbi:MAG: caspase family protein [Acidobacteriota bacterium]|nr:caspase family protein [Acidobacteriota bacterium]
MARGISLHVGLNRVDPLAYGGWEGDLVAAEADARDMEELARRQDFETLLLLSPAATRDAVLENIRNAAEELQPGDFFLLTYAGHGGRLPDIGGDESDLRDETWCLYDGQLVDDELGSLWYQFRRGVRVLAISDSCHSGTVTRGTPSGYGRRGESEDSMFVESAPRYRFMPDAVAARAFRANRELYLGIAESLVEGSPEPKASVRLLAGCQDDQFASDGPFNGLFTGVLKRVWGEGDFEGDYGEFFHQLCRRMPRSQRPNHVLLGEPDRGFDRQRPFEI